MYEVNTYNSIINKLGIKVPLEIEQCHQMVHQKQNKSCIRTTDFKTLRKKYFFSDVKKVLKTLDFTFIKIVPKTQRFAKNVNLLIQKNNKFSKIIY